MNRPLRRGDLVSASRPGGGTSILRFPFALRRFARLSILAIVGVGLAGPTSAVGVTLGSAMSAAATSSVCRFQSLEPTVHLCTIEQVELSPQHTAAGGLVAPFDGVITSWALKTGEWLSGTGTIKVSLRTHAPLSFSPAPFSSQQTPDFDLPPSPPGAIHTFPARIPIAAEQPVNLKITITNRNTAVAGAPIGFAESGIGELDVWSGGNGEPWGTGIWEREEGTEVLLSAELEPDTDHDGYGDITQDCYLNESSRELNELCGKDLSAPELRRQVAARQPFLRTGSIRLQVRSGEPGTARAGGWLQLKGQQGFFAARAGRSQVAAGAWTPMQIPLGRRALKVGRSAARSGKRMFFEGVVGVVDGAGNERQLHFRVRP